MLRELHIRNYALIQSLNLEFYPGFNVLSGETGSGKSILIDALGLVLGGRASADVIRTGEDRAMVTAVFEPDDNVKKRLAESGIDTVSGGELILKRGIQAEGRSRSLVDDQPVTLAALKQLGRHLVDIHGQNEHVALLAPDAQLDLLDEFAGNEARLDEVAELFHRRRELEREMDELARSEQERLRSLDLLKFQVQELRAARLDPGEDVRLEEEKRVLANAGKLRQAAETAYSALYEDENSALARLALAAKSLDELARYDSSATGQSESLISARASLEDAAAYLRDYAAKLEADPARLEEIEDRLARIDLLKRKYGKTIEEILEYAGQASLQLDRLEGADERRGRVASELADAASKYQQAAQALSRRRREAAKEIERASRRELAELGMENAAFRIHFADAGEGGVRGMDEIEMRISPNPGEEPRPLARTASGGELSRLMLALKNLIAARRSQGSNGSRKLGAGSDPAPRTLIFDEVDAGIGGRVAECVGQRLKRLSASAQVLCVTHLAQIACFADHHYYVEKTESQGRTITGVRRLSTERERAGELARMLSGSRITGAALEHAAAMLKHAAG